MLVNWNEYPIDILKIIRKYDEDLIKWYEFKKKIAKKHSTMSLYYENKNFFNFWGVTNFLNLVYLKPVFCNFHPYPSYKIKISFNYETGDYDVYNNDYFYNSNFINTLRNFTKNKALRML